MDRKGYIYLITNDINDKKYVGQTKRSIELRYSEHCFDKRSTSNIHKAIKEIGYTHFKVRELECVDYDKLDEREAYWVNYYDCYNNGYNKTKDGQPLFAKGEYRDSYQQIYVKEKNFYIDSKEELSNIIASLTKWSQRYISKKLRCALTEGKEFLGCHFYYCRCSEEDLTSIDDVESWIKDLDIEYSIKHIYCVELDKSFDSTAEAAIYLLQNKYWNKKSSAPIQAIISVISKGLKKEETIPNAFTIPLTFQYEYGNSKHGGSEGFEGKQVYCVEVNKNFSSVAECAKYLLDNDYFQGITLKTAKSRISDVARGYMQDYKGYHFFYIDENGEKIISELYKIQEEYFLQDTIEISKQEVLEKSDETSKKTQPSVSSNHGSWQTHKELADKYLELGSLGKVAKFYNASKSTVRKACEENGIFVPTLEEWQKNASIKIRVQFDNEEMEFDSVGQVIKYFNFPDSSVRRAIKTGKPYLKKYVFTKIV